MQCRKTKKPSPAKEIAYTAVASALITGAQYVFSFVSGVEIVTLLFICFSYRFGIRDGVVCAVAFSLLRSIIFGFYPTVIILYLIYYPSLCAVFGGLGHVGQSTFDKYPWYFAVAVNVLLSGLAVLSAVCCGLGLIKISAVYKTAVDVLLCLTSALCAVLCVTFDCLLIAEKAFKKNTGRALKLLTFASIAAVCTVCFTLLDDLITPLFFGYSRMTALAYFYASFTATLPQTVCTIVTVSTLFAPLNSVLEKV